MKNKFNYLFAAALLLPFAIPQASAGRNPSATGAGHYHTAGGELRTFSFAAIEHKGGRVSGQAQLFNREENVRIHIAIDFLVFSESGDEALMLGVIKSSNSPKYAVNEWAFFGVGDDAISVVFFEADWFPPPAPTHDELFGILPGFFSIGPFLTPIEGGNIQIRP